MFLTHKQQLLLEQVTLGIADLTKWNQVRKKGHSRLQGLIF